MDNLKRLKSTMTYTDWQVSACHCHSNPALVRLGLLPAQSRRWCSPPCLSKPELMTWLPWGELPLCPLMCWTLLLQSFESWMHKWLLFQMAKNPKSEDRKAIPAEKGTGDGTAELGRVGEVLAWGISQGTKPSLQSLTCLFSGEPVLLLLGHHRASLPVGHLG